MFAIYFHDEVVATSDASEAVAVYWAEVDAGTRPAIWRGDDPIVRIDRCEDCRAPVLMTPQDMSAYVGAFGELENGVLCGHCIDRMLDDEQAAYDEQAAWDREVYLMLNLAHVEQ